jgi:FkbM family methyltransferase
MKKINEGLLSVHHVGGRNGSRAFPIIEAFEKDIVNVLYDADTSCIEQAREQNASRASKLYVLPFCLADSCKKIDFHLNYDPFSSTTYKVNPEAAPLYWFNGGNLDSAMDHDYVYGEAATPLKTLQLDAVSMDHLFQSDAPPAPPPDFLSLDTEGSESDILRGAEETLKGVLGVYSEVAFQKLFQGGKLFGDMAQWLSERGFIFVNFPVVGAASAFRAPVGLRGEGFLFSGDALFLRSIDHLERTQTEPAALRTQLRKLAFISIAFGQMEYALECLRRTKGLPATRPAGDAEPSYERFLDELQACANRVQPLYPQKFKELHSPAQSLARFDVAAVTAARQNGTLKGFLKSVPVLGPTLVLTRRNLLRLRTAAKNFRRLPLLRSYSEVERLLRRYGLTTQAETLWRNRVAQTPCSRLATTAEEKVSHEAPLEIS